MKATLKVRNVIFGEGIPKICIPSTAANLAELKASAKAINEAPHDMVEWRADFYTNIEDTDVRAEALNFFRGALGETPILFTVRTTVEGGKLEISTEDYISLISSVIDTGLIDFVDVELSRGDDTMAAIKVVAHKAGVKVLGSLHDNFSTPSKDRIVHHLCQMQQMGADIVKFAVTPQSSRDVLTLLDATLTMIEEHANTPVITMSMGGPGAVSRVCGSVFGSCITFGTAGPASAPGQLPADLLSTFLKSLEYKQ